MQKMKVLMLRAWPQADSGAPLFTLPRLPIWAFVSVSQNSTRFSSLYTPPQEHFKEPSRFLQLEIIPSYLKRENKGRESDLLTKALNVGKCLGPL